jgi:hypothetical protein
MSTNTLDLQGRFTSTGANVQLNLRSGWDWIKVFNETVLFAAGGGNGAEFYFQNGMPNGRGTVYTKEATIGALVPTQIAANSGFFYLDTSSSPIGASAALTGITAANPPVVTSNGHGLSVGNIVRFNTLNNQPQIGGMDFTITAENTNTFTVGNINLLNSTATTTGFWTLIAHDHVWYPASRTVTYIRSAAQAVIYLSVTHGYQVGQSVRLSFPSASGGSSVWGVYAALDGVEVTITAVNVARAGSEPTNSGVANNIVVDYDTSAFAAWNTVFGSSNNQAYPASAKVPFTNAQVVPIGEDTAYALQQNVNILSGATVNTAIIGVTLQAGAGSPAGQNNDVIYWIAGTSFSNDLL